MGGGTGGEGQREAIRCKEVGKFHVFDPLPTWLDRVQLRRVRREVVKVEPAGMVVGERFGHGIVQRQIVPEQNDFTTIEKMQLPQKITAVVPSHAAGQKRITKVEIATMRRDRDKADAGRSLTTGASAMQALELPLRCNNPLPLVAGVNERNNATRNDQRPKAIASMADRRPIKQGENRCHRTFFICVQTVRFP